jgi:cysteine desulfurase
MDYAASVSPNPSSIHEYGVMAKHSLESARLLVAQVLKTQKQNIIFTSGGTESNNLAILGLISSLNTKALPHIVTTNIEHASVLETCKFLEKNKLAEITYVEVERSGVVDPKKIKKAIKKNTVLVSVMYANNEIGTIEPIAEIAKEIRHYNKQNLTKIFFHTDAVQAVNYLDLNVEKLGIDMMTLSGSKIEKGGKSGVLYKRNGVNLQPIMHGGDQEFGLRPGTENVDEIVKFSKALVETQKTKEKESKRLLNLQKYFLNKLMSKAAFGKDVGVVLNGDLKNRLPNNVNMTISNIPSDLLVLELSSKGIMISAKSACKSGDGKVSHVIQAINPNVKETDGSLRFSFGRNTSKEDLDFTVKSLTNILIKLEKWYH